MPLISITYDLRTPGRDYNSLYDEIKSLGSWAHYLESTWFVYTNHSIKTVSDRLTNKMDKNDYLFVTKLTAEYYGWLPTESWDWLNKYF